MSAPNVLDVPDVPGDLDRLELTNAQRTGVQRLGLRLWAWGYGVGVDAATRDDGAELRRQGRQEALDALCAAAQSLGRSTRLDVPLTQVLKHVGEEERAERLGREISAARAAWWASAHRLPQLFGLRQRRGEQPSAMRDEVSA